MMKLFLEDKFQFTLKRRDFSFQAKLGCLERKELCQWVPASGHAHLAGWLPGKTKQSWKFLEDISPPPPSMTIPAGKNLGGHEKAPYLSRGRCSRFQPG